MARTGEPAARTIAAVERAFAVLDSFAEAGAELGTNELARRTGINASTVSRLLATLAGAGLVEHIAASGRYRLGMRLVALGNAALAGLDLRAIARPHLEALAAETGETATLSAPGERDAVTIDFVQSPSSVQSVARLGRPSIGHATATGKVLLAFGEAAPAGRLERFTPRTIVDPARLSRELARVEARGFAEATREREDDLSAVAAPVFGAASELTAILGVQGPSSRFDREAMRTARASLLAHARAVSEALGWRANAKEAR
jgi:DNA-binding IclR family transcriptional regulator